MLKLRRPLVAATLAALPLGFVVPYADAVDEVDTARLREHVTVGDVFDHLRVFQRIANQNDGMRASGTRGFNRSARYIARRLEEAGLRVTTQEFTFPFYRELSPAVLQQVSPGPTDYQTLTYQFSGTGDVTGQVVPINPTIPPPAEPGTALSGCNGTPFPAAPAATAVALIQRGTCTFEEKAANAEARGYEAAIIYNEGQEGRTEPFQGTLNRPFDIPVVGMSFADAAAVVDQVESGDDVVVHVAATTEFKPRARTSNVIGTLPGGDREHTIVAGAHLDSVPAGPGINDNGTGSAVILEIAEQMAELGVTTRQRVRFAFWGAEEPGLLGSQHYVDTLTDRQLGRISANLNFDMLGSPNYARFVYDGDGSATEPAGPTGSGAIEDVFTDYFDRQGLRSAPTQFSGRSDYGPFIAVGIPAGGLFSGAEGVKTEEQADLFGGTAGVAYDECYHQACDDIDNVNTDAVNELGDAAAHAVATLAKTRSGWFPDGSLRVHHRATAEVRQARSIHPRR